MGFFKKTGALSSYPARRNRLQNEQNHQNPTAANPPSNYGAHNPTPMPASVYQTNGMSVAPAAATTTTTAAVAAPYNAVAYGAFPGNNAPVQATVYIPGQGASTAPTPVSTAAPVQATAYVPGTVSSIPPAAATATAQVHTAAPVQATVYNPNNDSTPAANPSFLGAQQRASFNNGNGNYNANESSFWECSVCTFPNLRTEPNCKGCGAVIPPGMLYSAASSATAQQPPTQQRPPQDAYNNITSQMNSMGLEGAKIGGAGTTSAGAPSSAANTGAGVMRVHIPLNMTTGQKIKVRSPDGKEVVQTIPPQSQWHYDGTQPFFRMQFGGSPAPPTTAYGRDDGNNHNTNAPTMAHDVPPMHTTAWRDFCHAPGAGHYSSPPLALQSVPSTPIGSGMPMRPNGRHKCLIIGINYTGSRAQLRGCINDAKNMQGLLRRNGYPDDGSHMLLLTDERNRGREYQPNKEMITKAFAWLMKDVRKGDVLFFHFSGHGGQQRDTTGMEVDGYNETLIPVDYDRKGQISDDVLWGSLVYRLPEGARITALMDMCHSGTGLDLPYDYNVDTRSWTEDINPAHSAGDVVLFSGCEDAQTSADVAGAGRQAGGAMTQAFMGAYNTCNNDAATYHEFLTAVKKELRKKKFSQRPQLTSSQRFDAKSRVFALGYASGGCGGGGGSIPSVIEPNHNPKIGRMKRQNIRRQRHGLGGGGGNNFFGMMAGAAGAALFADALF